MNSGGRVLPWRTEFAVVHGTLPTACRDARRTAAHCRGYGISYDRSRDFRRQDSPQQVGNDVRAMAGE